MALQSWRFVRNKRLQRAARDSPPIRVGETDRQAVALIQGALAVLGYGLPMSRKRDGSFNGVFGWETREAVMSFQQEHKLLDQKGTPSGIADNKTLHMLDNEVREIQFYQIDEKPKLVKQTEYRCWAAAIESLTSGRYTVDWLVKKFTERADGLLDYSQIGNVFYRIGGRIGVYQGRDPQLLGLALLTDLTAKRYVLLLVKGSAGTAHAVVVYGADGVRGRAERVFINYMDPLSGYVTDELGPILEQAERVWVGRIERDER